MLRGIDWDMSPSYFIRMMKLLLISALLLCLMMVAALILCVLLLAAVLLCLLLLTALLLQIYRTLPIDANRYHMMIRKIIELY